MIDLISLEKNRSTFLLNYYNTSIFGTTSNRKVLLTVNSVSVVLDNLKLYPLNFLLGCGSSVVGGLDPGLGARELLLADEQFRIHVRHKSVFSDCNKGLSILLKITVMVLLKI